LVGGLMGALVGEMVEGLVGDAVGVLVGDWVTGVFVGEFVGGLVGARIGDSVAVGSFVCILVGALLGVEVREGISDIMLNNMLSTFLHVLMINRTPFPEAAAFGKWKHFPESIDLIWVEVPDPDTDHSVELLFEHVF
jgi:hypothetical protein